MAHTFLTAYIATLGAGCAAITIAATAAAARATWQRTTTSAPALHLRAWLHTRRQRPRPTRHRR